MSSNTQDLLLYSAMGFCLGVGFFFKGFWIYRKYRLLADTPKTSIRSIAMGLVQIEGRTKGTDFVNSPLTGTPCFFYQVAIEAREEQDDDIGEQSMVSLVVETAIDHSPARWHRIKTVAHGVRFFIEDRTGTAHVDARGAELDLVEIGQWEQEKPSGKFVTSILHYGSHVVSDDVLKNYAAAQGVRLSSRALRLTESCILPGQLLSVIGTCTENPKPRDEGDRNLIIKGDNDPTFMISWGSEKATEEKLRNRAILCIFGGATVSIVCVTIILIKLGWF